MKKFKTESQRVLDLMINSIYTHKDIFLRELLSNCSDAMDKLYYKSLTEGVTGLSREDFGIDIHADKTARTLTITDNGIGMSETDLDNNLGVIARSGSLLFKNENEAKEDVNIIGQFGVGFYSAFMVAKRVEVLSKAYGSEEACLWISEGTSGYDIKKAEKDDRGTTVTLFLKDNTEDENYDRFLDEYEIKSLVKKYSDYIRYPIRTEMLKKGEKEEEYTETEVLNSMVPLWKKNKNEITAEEYDKFYADMFFDAEKPLRTVHTSAEGAVDYKAMLFVPSHPQYNYYSKNYEKGLRLYTNGVLITDNCKELLPDCFSFVKGLVDSELTLNISRETIQHNRQLVKIASSLEKKIKTELKNMLDNDRDAYLKFFEGFGLQLKYGLYDNWGQNKELLQDLVLFRSLEQDKFITLSDYVAAMKEEQKFIYYATGKTVDAIKNLPQCEKIRDEGFDVLCFTDDVDEFAIRFLFDYQGKEFRSVSAEDTGVENTNDSVENAPLADFVKEALNGKIAKVKFGGRLKTHPVCLSSEGELSIEMEKVLSGMPNAPKEGVKATKVLEINASHPVYEKLNSAFQTDKEKAKDISEVLYAQALLIEGMPIDDPTKLADLVCKLLG